MHKIYWETDMRKLIAFICIFISFGISGDEPYILMVSFDGFRSDYTNLTTTPNFDRLGEKGVKADGLIPVFPSLTFPNHYSIATGAYPGTHNITGNSFYDKKYGEKFSLSDRDKVRDPKFYKSEPIWVTAERQGVHSASYFWVGTEAPVKGYSPSIFKYYDGSVPFRSRIDTVISWFQLPEKKRPRLVMLYFSEPDHTGHKMGASHPDIHTIVAEMDSLLGYLMESLEKLEIYGELNMFVVSDHGMADVSNERLIILDDYISRMDDVYIDGRGSHVQFNFKKGQDGYFEDLQDELKKIPNCQFWNRDNIPDRFHFINRNTGVYLLLANEGWFITTKFDMEEGPFDLSGMHGYDPELLSMHGIFYAVGESIREGIQISAFENIHIYPLICSLLDISPYDGKEDSPQGDIEVLKKILIKDRKK